MKVVSGELALEADDMWRFVGRKKCTWWIWVALDAETRQVGAMMAGDRTDFTARCLWEAVPQEYRDGATIHTDFLATLPGGAAGRASRGLRQGEGADQPRRAVLVHGEATVRPVREEVTLVLAVRL